MRKTNEELDAMIAEQEDLLAGEAGMVDIQRGHVSKSLGKLAANRIAAIEALESRKELSSVNLKAGI